MQTCRGVQQLERFEQASKRGQRSPTFEAFATSALSAHIGDDGTTAFSSAMARKHTPKLQQMHRASDKLQASVLRRWGAVQRDGPTLPQVRFNLGRRRGVALG